MIFSLFVVIVLLVIIFMLIYRNTRNERVIAEQDLNMQRQKVTELEKDRQISSTQALIEGETSERARISRDLHDGLGGMLSVVKLKIADMKGSMTIDEEHVPVFKGALEMLDQSIAELRRVAHNLMPESLTKYGLNLALKDFCSSIRMVDYHFFGEDRRLEDRLEVTCYRIVNELVNNSLKHSEATTINVQLILEARRVSILVQDNGKGFEINAIDENKCNGIKNIKSRVSSFAGRLDIVSKKNEGTEITVEFNC
jgi:signal transduction histidine kinase